MRRRSTQHFGFAALVGPLWLVIPLCCILATPAASDESEDLVGQLKVAYLYNFTRFIDWPPIPTGQPFVIGVIGDADMSRRLRILERENRSAQGRPIEVRVYEAARAIESCEMLFVGAGATGETEAIVRYAAKKPMLLVSDVPGSSAQGIAIELFLKPDLFREKKRLRFRIHPAVLKDIGLSVSAQLMDVAEVVE